MTKSNKILCIIGAILIAFVGLFCIVFATKDDRVVKADSITSDGYTFTSDNFVLPSAVFSTAADTSTINTNFNDFLSFNFTFSPSGLNFKYASSGYATSGVTATIFSDAPVGFVVGDWASRWFVTENSPSSARYFVLYVYQNSASFNNNIQYIRLQRASTIAGQYKGTQMFFYDNNDNYVEIQVPIYTGNSYTANYFNFVTDRTIYLNDLSTLTDNQYYQLGRQDGLTENQSNIFDDGYNQAIDDNKQNWIDYGVQQGIAQANDYTFLSLIGATIDAPISAFTSFFDFELLGVNLKNFFFAILTFALVIVIIRFSLGK